MRREADSQAISPDARRASACGKFAALESVKFLSDLSSAPTFKVYESISHNAGNPRVGRTVHRTAAGLAGPAPR